jgi:hypothetical protein
MGGESPPAGFVTLTQAGASKGAHPSTIRSAILAGHLPAQKDGRCWVVAEADLAAWEPNAALHLAAARRALARLTECLRSTAGRTVSPSHR